MEQRRLASAPAATDSSGPCGVQRRHPSWVRAGVPVAGAFFETRHLLRGLRLTTVCEEARCPNRRECWSHGAATIMLLGQICTRGCRFCAVATGRPQPVDPGEPDRVAGAVAAMRLEYVVVTSVARDDLPDGGAAHFAETARAIRRRLPRCRIEALVPDFRGMGRSIDAVVDAPIDVLSHNTETVPRLYHRVRPGAEYHRTLDLLRRGRTRRPGLVAKSGLMLGLGETAGELETVFDDLAAAGCQVLTLGQYLRPSAAQLPVERYLQPGEFVEWRRRALQRGFAHVESGPLVRSSYHAWQHLPMAGTRDTI